MRLPKFQAPASRYATTTDDRGVVWRHDNRNLDAKPVKVFDPNYVPTWERWEFVTHEDGSVTGDMMLVEHTGPYPTPKALDYAVYGSIASTLLLVGVLIGAAA